MQFECCCLSWVPLSREGSWGRRRKRRWTISGWTLPRAAGEGKGICPRTGIFREWTQQLCKSLELCWANEKKFFGSYSPGNGVIHKKGLVCVWTHRPHHPPQLHSHFPLLSLISLLADCLLRLHLWGFFTVLNRFFFALKNRSSQLKEVSEWMLCPGLFVFSDSYWQSLKKC